MNSKRSAITRRTVAARPRRHASRCPIWKSWAATTLAAAHGAKRTAAARLLLHPRRHRPAQLVPRATPASTTRSPRRTSRSRITATILGADEPVAHPRPHQRPRPSVQLADRPQHQPHARHDHQHGLDGPGGGASTSGRPRCRRSRCRCKTASARARSRATRWASTSRRSPTTAPSSSACSRRPTRRSSRPPRPALTWIAASSTRRWATCRISSATLGRVDAQRLDQYLESIREVENAASIDSEEILDRGRPQFDEESVRLAPQGKNSMREHIELMMDLIALAFQTDMTRVVTHSLGGEGGPNYDEYKDWAEKAGRPGARRARRPPQRFRQPRRRQPRRAR